MILFRSADASMVWALEVARIWLIVFGCAAAAWAVGFGIGYRRRGKRRDQRRRPQAGPSDEWGLDQRCPSGTPPQRLLRSRKR